MQSAGTMRTRNLSACQFALFAQHETTHRHIFKYCLPVLWHQFSTVSFNQRYPLHFLAIRWPSEELHTNSNQFSCSTMWHPGCQFGWKCIFLHSTRETIARGISDSKSANIVEGHTPGWSDFRSRRSDGQSCYIGVHRPRGFWYIHMSVNERYATPPVLCLQDSECLQFSHLAQLIVWELKGQILKKIIFLATKNNILFIEIVQFLFYININ